MTKHNRKKPAVRRKRSGKQDRKAVVAREESTIHSQKNLAQPTVIVTKAFQPPPSQGDMRKIRIGHNITLTSATSAPAIDDHSDQTAGNGCSTQVERNARKGQAPDSSSNRKDLRAFQVGKGRIKQRREQEETLEESHVAEPTTAELVDQRPISRTVLMAQLGSMAADLGKAQARVIELQKDLDEKTTQVEVALSFLNQCNSLSGADIINLAESLNADIFQSAALIADMSDSSTFLTAGETDVYKTALEQTYMLLGTDLADALRVEAKRGSGKFVLQIALQICMVTLCVNVIRSWAPEENEGRVLAEMYAKILTKEKQPVAGRWRSITRGITHERRDPKTIMDAIIATITDILVVRGCWNKRRKAKSKIFFTAFHESLERVVDGALKLQTAAGEQITGMDIEPITIRPGSHFNRQIMEASYASNIAVDDEDCVLNTTEIGLAKSINEPPGTQLDTILLKPKVLLCSVLNYGLTLDDYE